MKVALLGTGLMGAHMARNIARGGHEIAVWNRTRAKAEPLANIARVADGASDAVEGAEIVVTMLSHGAAVAALVLEGGVADAMKPGAILVDMSSIKPAEARTHAEALRAKGLHHLDAPVSGGTRGAEAATLAIMAGGEEAVFERARPVLATMGRPTRVGPDGAGQLAKLCNQTIVAVTIGVVAEAVMLAERRGADPDAVRAALKGGFADSVILQQHGGRMTARDFEPGGLSKLQLKDLDNALEEAGNVELPLTRQVRERFETLVNEMEGGGLDHSALYLELERRQRD